MTRDRYTNIYDKNAFLTYIYNDRISTRSLIIRTHTHRRLIRLGVSRTSQKAPLCFNDPKCNLSLASPARIIPPRRRDVTNYKALQPSAVYIPTHTHIHNPISNYENPSTVIISRLSRHDHRAFFGSPRVRYTRGKKP